MSAASRSTRTFIDDERVVELPSPICLMRGRIDSKIVLACQNAITDTIQQAAFWNGVNQAQQIFRLLGSLKKPEILIAGELHSEGANTGQTRARASSRTFAKCEPISVLSRIMAALAVLAPCQSHAISCHGLLPQFWVAFQ